MSAKSSLSPESSNDPAAAGAPRARRISTPRPRKPAKDTPPAAALPDFSVAAPLPPQVAESQPQRTDWPEPDAASPGAAGPAEHAKRKRRRKKGKGNAPQPQLAGQDEEPFPLEPGEPAPPAAVPAPHGQPAHPGHAPRVRIDPEVLATRAWKIYLSEVSEEGVALVGDNDAKDLARRCFRLAEIFIEEQARHR
ncbi:MAG: hypothetical protein WCJ14_01725 [Verrucomicrobiota bacterium]